MSDTIAILSANDFSVIGGAERLIIDLARVLNADVVVPASNRDAINLYDSKKEVNFNILSKKLPSEPWKQISGMRLFKKINLSYDFVISMDDMSLRYLAKNPLHLYYMLTPRRALYDMYYPTIRSIGYPQKIAYWPILNSFRFLDMKFVNKYVNNIACISHTVRNRIFKAYGKNAGVLYPPVHVERYLNREPEGFWLSVGRIDKWKRVDLQIEAFRNIPGKELRVVGEVYPEYRLMVENAPPNVTFVGTVGEEELRDLYSRCEGFITTAIDEDFGLTPLEAMASGKPVVATKEGGYLETVLDGYTGRLVSPDPDAIRSAVYEIAADPEKYRDSCIKRAELFSFDAFKKEAQELLKKIHSP